MISEIINNLQPKERQLLMYAFENEFSQYITLPGNRYIGVNTHSVKHLTIDESAGKWTYGKVRG